ncbi:MAG: MBL fold metallo-hydrolase [Planctomycetota bacterium]|jgi:glyoxylase-like metal-dependent hydrolase (beta-lactamase superfamily II)
MVRQNNQTTRRRFLKNSAAAATGAVFLAKSLSANVYAMAAAPPKSKKTDSRTNRGNPPVATMAPWGQKVQHDTSTYIEMQKYARLKKNQKWDDGAEIARRIRAQIKSGDLVIQNPPIRLLAGLWVLCGDSQQRTYLADTGDGLLLVDPSYDAFTEEIVRQIKSLGYTQRNVRWVLLTHCHADHTQSTPYWRKKGAEILIHSADLNPIRTGNEITAWGGLPEPRRYFTPVTGPVTTFGDGDKLSFGSFKLSVIHTPGHTPGSSCFYFKHEGKNVLLSQDIVLHFGRHAWMGNAYVDWQQYIKSLWKIKRFYTRRSRSTEPVKYDLLLPGHGTIGLDNAVRDVDYTIKVVSYIINQRLTGSDLDWIDPYEFFWERQRTNADPIRIQYR